jgi:WXG100 family type VII secretion target
MDIQLKVAPDVLKGKAQEITQQVNSLSNDWKAMCNVILKSKSYWEGEASDYHRKTFDENKSDVEQILRRLKEHPKDLQVMAGIYTQAEADAAKLASSLPDEIIV